MVEVGAKAPDFDAKLADGTPFRLSSLKGSPVVLYFYPKADTPGCTVESKGFRDEHDQYRSRKVEVVGVSVDDCPAQKAFAEKYGLPFRLVADPEKSVARAYGVLGPQGVARRVSFLLGPDHQVLEIVDSPKAEVHLAAARQRFLGA
ncbi:bacterioferritin comigratory protein [mine drainage metagenome]|uniref:thioredoxin-dependent peroxiredoxin n=1 Tax=mine drainage metagenome TaxID=410659 RepID=T1C3F2_9ZZZZ